MSTARNSIVLAAALLLAACGSDQEPEAAETQAANAQQPAEQPPSTQNSADALQPVDNSARATQPNGQQSDDGMEWNFSRAAGVPKLAFGEPQTDNVRLMLRCPESGQALLSFLRPAEFAEGKPDMLAIVSGNSRRSITIETEQGPLGTTVTAQAPVSAGPLQQFRSGNRLEVNWGDETIGVPGSPEGPIRQFFEACS